MAETQEASWPKEAVETAIVALGRYLVEDYWPKDQGYSRHALTGPAGKMLEVVQSGRITDREAILGYVTQVHNQSSARSLDAAGLERLGAAVDAIVSIRSQVSDRAWIRALREIGYGVYLVKYAAVQERARLNREGKATESEQVADIDPEV